MLPNLRLGTEIGRGSYGKVCKATLDKNPVAAKVLHDHLFERQFVDDFQKECRILQRLQHKNIVQLVDFYIPDSSPPILITELLDCDLGKYILQTQRNKIPFPEIVSIMLDVAEGLAYLHNECNPPIAHRDLASKNVLLTKTKQAKIADLGLAKLFSSRHQRMLASPVPGTPAYAAPETYSANPASRKVEYSVKIDVFSFGVMLMEMINGRPPKVDQEPFDSDGHSIPENERRKDDISKMGEHRLKGLVLRCIENDNDKRSDAKEVVRRLQKESKIVERKKAIVRRRKPNQPPSLRIITLGEAGTGKTSIIKYFQTNSYFDSVIPTMGLDFCRKEITLYGKEFSLTISDTAGLERYMSITPLFLRDADGILLIYDITDGDSFEKSIPGMLELINKYSDNSPSMILVGNKVDAVRDQPHQRAVTRKQAEELASNLGVPFMETSAKTGENINKVFVKLTEEIYRTLDLSDIETYSLTGNDRMPLGQGQSEANTWCSSSWC